MFITPSFKKSLIVEQFQGNYLNLKTLGILKHWSKESWSQPEVPMYLSFPYFPSSGVSQQTKHFLTDRSDSGLCCVHLAANRSQYQTCNSNISNNFIVVFNVVQ